MTSEEVKSDYGPAISVSHVKKDTFALTACSTLEFGLAWIHKAWLANETADQCPTRLSPVLFSSSKSGHEASVKVSRGFQGAFWLSWVVQCKTHARLGQHWFYWLFAIDFHRQTAESFCIPSPLVSFSRLHFVIVSDCIYARKNIETPNKIGQIVVCFRSSDHVRVQDASVRPWSE